MPVDEFGREIPVPSALPRRGNPPPASLYASSSGLSYHHDHHHPPRHHQPSSYPPIPRGPQQLPPPQLSLPLSTPRHSDRDRDRDRDRGRDRGDPPSSSYHAHHSSSNYPPLAPPAHKPPTAVPKASHPSKAYQEEPLLCEYLWKQQQQQQKPPGDEPEEEAVAPQHLQKEYSDYRRAYCLRFIKAFFNAHLDHSWFRNLYSPSCQRRVIEQENARARQEAAELARALQGDDDAATAFLKGLELWGTVEAKKSGEWPVPEAHQLAAAPRTLLVADIPPHVTDDQVVAALVALVKGDSGGAADPGAGAGDNGSYFQLSCTEPRRHPAERFLYRDAVVLCQSPAYRQCVLSGLVAQQPEGGGAGEASRPPSGLIPRKEGDAFSTTSSSTRSGGNRAGTGRSYELEVDCSDPYGRMEVDVDPRAGGGAGDALLPDDPALLPRLKATVHVRELPPPPVHLLTLALSSPSRISSDKEAAIVAARALDAAKRVDDGSKLDDILELHGAGMTEAQILDVTVAYLRRVHLFCFYKCSSATNLAQFLTDPKLSNIYVRLRTSSDDASAEDATAEDPVVDPDDLLVKSRDEQIAAMLEACPTWISGESAAAATASTDGASGPDAPSTSVSSVVVGVVTEAMQEQADAIEEAERAAVETWLNDHSLLDDDKRARCSFHFCHKLFKDSVFLRKHLMKKHGEFLRAEQAKCHDEYMMASWEACSNRPLCDILVDCGANFGLVPTRFLPQALPDCVDPEPELWQREEEKRKAAEEQRQRREEMRQQQQQQGTGPAVSRAFVDVDDMKEEKVEISFDNVPDPTAILIKKKKKRKLL